MLTQEAKAPPQPAPRARERIESAATEEKKVTKSENPTNLYVAHRQVTRKPVPREEENTEVEEEAEKEEVVKKKMTRDTKEGPKRKTNKAVQEKGTEKSEPTKPKKKLERENTFTKEEPAATSEKKDDVSQDATSQDEPKVEPKNYSSLDAKSERKLDKIIKSRAKASEAKTKDKPKSEETKVDSKPAEKEDPKMKLGGKPLSSLTKKRSILKSLSGKHVGSEESADLAVHDHDKAKAEDSKEKEAVAKPKPLSFKERSRQLFSKGSSSKDKELLAEQSSNDRKDEKDKSKSSEEEYSGEEASEEEEESFDSEEDSEDDEEGDTEDESDQEGDSSDDDDMTTTTEQTTTKGDTSTTSESRGLPKAISVLPDLHKVEAMGSDSHDSEGVIVKKSPTVKKTSVASKDNIVIIVSDFEAAKDAKFVEDDQVSQLYVEYKFLDLPVEDLETPFSLPKPAPQEKITFNFRKVFAVDRTENSGRRRLVSKMLRSEDDASRLLTFLVVSEPPDPEEDCVDLGEATLDLGSILRTGQDIEDQVLEVFGSSGEENTVLGTLTVSVLAAKAFKSIVG